MGACLAYDAWALWFLGYPQQALQRSHEALTWAENVAHPYGVVFVLNLVGRVHQLRRETRVTRQQAEMNIALSTEHGFAQFLATSTIMQGWALAQEQREEGITMLSQGLVLYQATGAALNQPCHLALLAEAYSTIEQAEEGLRVLSTALALVDKNDERFYEAELYRLKGEFVLALSEDNRTEAEACFQQALAIARRQQAKSWELRTATSLARLWQRQGQCAEAHQLLAPVYGWFTEGLDTADLCDARALLEELA